VFSVDVSHFDDVSSINDVQVWSMSLCGMDELATQGQMCLYTQHDEMNLIPTTPINIPNFDF